MATANQIINFQKQYRELSQAAHFFLDPQNLDKDYHGWSFKAVQEVLQDVVFNLGAIGLVDLSEVSEFDFRQFTEILDSFLKSFNEDLEAAAVPQDLEAMIEALEERNLQDEEMLAAIQKKNKTRWEFQKRRHELQTKFSRFAETSINQTEVNQSLPQIAQTLAEEIPQLGIDPARAGQSPILREKLQADGQEIYRKAINNITDISPETKAYLLSREISAETLLQITARPDQVDTILQKVTAPLTPKQIKYIQEVLAPALAIDTINAQTSEEIKNFVTLRAAEHLDELTALNLSQDQIASLIGDLSRAISPTAKTVAETPLLTIIGNEIVFPLNTPAVPGNQGGELIKITGTTGRPVGEEIRQEIKTARFDSLTINQIQNEAKKIIWLHQTVQTGNSPENLEKIAALKIRSGNLKNAPLETKFRSFVADLRQFQQSFFKPTELSRLAGNRFAFVQKIVQIPSPRQFIIQKAGSWLAKTGLGKTISSKIAQMGLQKIFNFVSKKTVQKAAGQIIKEGLIKIAGALGLDAAAGALTAGVGTVVLLAIQIGGKIIKSIWDKGKKFFAALLSIDEKDLDLKNIFIFLFIGIFILPTLQLLNIGGAFLSEQMGGLTEETPGSTGGSIEAPAACSNPRHLAEEYICLITKGTAPCNVTNINGTTRTRVAVCLNNLTLINNEGIEELKNQLTSYFCFNDPIPNCPFQCLQFVSHIQAALGQPINGDYGYAGQLASDPPREYQKVTTPKTGDLAVWKGNPGHIAIFIQTVPDSPAEIIVAEANYDLAGAIGIRKRPGLGMGSGPTVYLRYCPNGKCQ